MSDWLNDLPKERIYSPKHNTSNGYSDLYGARKVLRNYCRANYESQIRDIYIAHGTTPPWELLTWPQLITGVNARCFLVTREDEGEFLRANGHCAIPIGLPIVYLPSVYVNRIENSLLVMPPHLLEVYSYENQSKQIKRYVDYVSSIRGDFQVISVVINRICYEKGLWKDEFEKIGLKVIIGANKNDENALLRQKMLFLKHSHLTTSGWGSHVAYGLHYGCKTSIIGPELTISHADLMKDYNDENCVSYLKSDFFDIYKKNWLSRFKVSHPKNGVTDKKMGDFFVGYTCKKKPKDLAAILEWRVRRDKKIFKDVYYFLSKKAELKYLLKF